MKKVMTVVTLLLCSLSVFAQPTDAIQSWSAPPYWSPPAVSPEDGDQSGRTALATGRQALAAGPVALPFISLPPCRLVDTRGNAPLTGGFLPSATVRSYTLTGVCNVPVNAQAISLNATVVKPVGPGFLVLYPQGGTFPPVSTLNYLGNDVIVNAAVVPLSASGGISIALGVSGGDVVLDTNGYYAATPSVTSLNTLTGDLTLVAGTNVTITPSGNTLTIDAPLTSLSASNLTTGTLPSARLSGAYSGAISFSNLVNATLTTGLTLTGATVTGGTFGGGIFGGAFVGDGSGLTSLPGNSNLYIRNQSAAPQSASLRINGTVRMGNETGTSEGPSYPAAGGLVVRRVYSSTTTAGSVVARSDFIQLERDGTNAGLRVTGLGGGSCGGSCEHIACMAVTSSGTLMGKSLGVNTFGGPAVLFADADSVEYLRCTFGQIELPSGVQNQTSVELSRRNGGFRPEVWKGFLISTLNQ